jgi:predicted phosphodiesterase
MRIVAISDTHGLHAQVQVPPGDVLVHAGDFTGRGRPHEIEAFSAWIAAQPHRHKLVIAGNHDLSFEDSPAEAQRALRGCTYLQDSGITVDGVHFWGSPWQPEFMDWAFNLPRGGPLAARWALIPDATDVLITHGPPKGILDRCYDGVDAGCEALSAALARVRPDVHIFGHIHEAAGQLERHGTRYVNACSCDLQYRPVQPAVVIDV